MARRLFIGGYGDGRWIDVRDDVPWFKVAEFPQIDLASISRITEATTMSTFTEHLYKLESIHFGPDHIESFYIEKSLTPLDAFRKLLEGYRGTQSR